MDFAAKYMAKSYIGKIKKEFIGDDEEEKEKEKPVFEREEEPPKREIVKAKDKREFGIGF
jgi:hypothetical protein